MLRRCRYCPKSRPLSEYTPKPDGTFWALWDYHRAYVAENKRTHYKNKKKGVVNAYIECDLRCDYWEHCNQDVVRNELVWLPCTPIEQWPVVAKVEVMG